MSKWDNSFRLIGIFAVGWIVLFTVTYVSPGPGYNLTKVYSAYSYPILLFTAAIVCLTYTVSYRYLPVDRDITGVFGVLLVLMVLPSVSDPSSLRWVLPVAVWHAMIYVVLLLTILDFSVSIREYEYYLSLFIVAFGVTSAVVGLYTGLVADIPLGPLSVAQGTTDRFFGWYGNPNPFGSMIGVAILCSLSAYASTSSTKRWFYLLPLIVCIPGLAFSVSHGAIVSTTIATVVLFVFRTRHAENLAVVGIGASILVFAVLMALVGIGELSTLIYLVDEGSLGLLSRVNIWSNLSWILSDASALQILLGHGHKYFIQSVGQSPHNGYIRSLVNYGIVFLVFLIILARNVFRWTWWSLQEPKYDMSLFISFVVFLILKDIPSQSTFHVRFEGFLMVATLIPFAVIAIRESE